MRSLLSKATAIYTLVLALLNPALAATPATVVVAEVKAVERTEQLHYFGYVKAKGIYDIVAATSGLVSNMNMTALSDNSLEPLLRINPLDPSYASVPVVNRLHNATLYRKHVENGTFVKQQQVLLQLAKDPHFVIAFRVPAYEVKYIQQSQLSAELFPGSDEAQSIALGDLYTDAPAPQSTFHHFEVRIRCDKQRPCPSADLSGAFAKLVVNKRQKPQLTLPKAALFNGQNQVFVVNDQGVLVLTEVLLGKVDENHVEIQSGLRAGEQVVVRYVNVPQPGQFAQVVSMTQFKAHF